MTKPPTSPAECSPLSAQLRRLAATRLGRLTVQFGLFGVAGVIGLIVDIAVLRLLMEGVGLGPYSARVGSFLTAATTTWIINRHYAFRGDHAGTLIGQWARFVGANSFGGAINYLTYALLVARVPLVAANPALGVAAGSLAGMVINFVASKKLVFRSV